MTLAEILERFEGLKIIVAGDPMVDVYHFGRVERVSQEAPVPVFIEERVDKRLGGAANVWHQLAELKCDVRAAYSLDSTKWTEKHRYLVGSHQLFRVDFDRSVERAGYIDWCVSAVVVSDYGKGAVSLEMMAGAIDGGQPVIVDPKGEDWDKYGGATVMCPNESEFRAFNGSRLPTQPVFPHIVLKMGEKGIDLYSRDCWVRPERYPAQAKHVFDVTGAGDTVTAVVAATIAAGGSMPQACQLANLAAGYVVGEVGTTVCPIEKLKELLP
jgi:rfaE bifunctional protein kinase chain/domain